MRNFHEPRRSPVFAMGGMAATSHPLASEAALSTLKQGGNAVDAAVSAALVQCVVEPQMVGIGGDCFALVSEPDGRIYGLNSSGRAPAAADADRLRASGMTEIGNSSVHSVTVPGAVRGFETLVDRFGRHGLDAALVRAIGLASGGFPVSPRVAWDWERSESLDGHPGAVRHLLIDGKPPVAGQIVAFPELAESLQAIAEGGSARFYEGEIAEDIVATLAADGGVMTLDDMAAAKADWVDPISRTYRGLEVVELPPNGQGAIALLMLGILERFDFTGMDPAGPERFHLHMEAARAAYAVRDACLADPDYMQIEPTGLFDDDLAGRIAAQIDPKARNAALGSAMPGGSDTIYLTVADGEGRIVSLIASLFANFGSRIVTEKTGIVLHNRGSSFNLTPGHPNEYAPGKRPLHTIIPAMARQDGETVCGFGVMGGQYQAAGHAHAIANLVDFGMDPQAALDAPRMFIDGDRLSAEQTVSVETRTRLEGMGHEVAISDVPIGGGQIIWRDRKSGCYIAGSEPRKDGFAAGF
jgi:gamma-glutamyltranspeptidase/glutathione hydrolase